MIYLIVLCLAVIAGGAVMALVIRNNKKSVDKAEKIIDVLKE